ncbi:hypothetical protein LWC34_30450 [Kibdelosporangium philippinense]|uniref:Uncharacterized protein n=1 Tax=Kibdelosporangium philippinense TaxID=211113 RepID=A0ABS8ZH66_9PSEU|nr:hypothetical protein [Kibdelosporangium philippinense]MCE7007115.1 hypothetical protein [Kibdelosporangium philippinense]
MARLVSPTQVSVWVRLPWRGVRVRVIRKTCAASGNATPWGVVRTWMVRYSIRPCPVSVAVRMLAFVQDNPVRTVCSRC